MTAKQQRVTTYARDQGGFLCDGEHFQPSLSGQEP